VSDDWGLLVEAVLFPRTKTEVRVSDDFDDREDSREYDPVEIDPDEHERLKAEHAAAMATIATIVGFLRALGAVVEAESRGATGEKAQLLTMIKLLLRGVQA
jgi:hypothetical protein